MSNDSETSCEPIAWLHDQPGRYDVIHDRIKLLWLKTVRKRVEHYTIPLYRHARREPLTYEVASALLKATIGVDPMLDGNYLKLLRAIEQEHGIGDHTVPVKGGIEQ